MASPPVTPAVYRRRRIIALALGAIGLVVLLVSVLGGGGDGDRPAPARHRAAAPPRLLQLPGGGRRLLPDRRIVAFYGAPQAKELGELGIGSPASATTRGSRTR